MKQGNKLRNNQAFSILEVIIAVSIMAVISVGIMQLVDNMSKSKRNIEDVVEVTNFVNNEIAGTLAVANSCKSTFGELSSVISGTNLITLPVVNDQIKLFSEDNDSTVIKDFEFELKNGAGKVIADLKKSNLNLSSQLIQKYKINDIRYFKINTADKKMDLGPVLGIKDVKIHYGFIYLNFIKINGNFQTRYYKVPLNLVTEVTTGKIKDCLVESPQTAKAKCQFEGNFWDTAGETANDPDSANCVPKDSCLDFGSYFYHSDSTAGAPPVFVNPYSKSYSCPVFQNVKTYNGGYASVLTTTGCAPNSFCSKNYPIIKCLKCYNVLNGGPYTAADTTVHVSTVTFPVVVIPPPVTPPTPPPPTPPVIPGGGDEHY